MCRRCFKQTENHDKKKVSMTPKRRRRRRGEGRREEGEGRREKETMIFIIPYQ